MVFFSSCMSVKFHNELLNYIGNLTEKLKNQIQNWLKKNIKPCNIQIFPCSVSTASRSRPSGPPPSFPSAMRTPAFYSAQTSPPEVMPVSECFAIFQFTRNYINSIFPTFHHIIIGLDIPDVDWIVQFDPPDDPKEYIHR